VRDEGRVRKYNNEIMTNSNMVMSSTKWSMMEKDKVAFRLSYNPLEDAEI
jgi:hypothetical protein